MAVISGGIPVALKCTIVGAERRPIRLSGTVKLSDIGYSVMWYSLRITQSAMPSMCTSTVPSTGTSTSADIPTGDAGREAERGMGATLADPRPPFNGPWSADGQADKRL